jgi:hypothetical protein
MSQQDFRDSILYLLSYPFASRPFLRCRRVPSCSHTSLHNVLRKIGTGLWSLIVELLNFELREAWNFGTLGTCVSLKRFERSIAIERLERLERTDPRDERSQGVERLERALGFARERPFTPKKPALSL